MSCALKPAPIAFLIPGYVSSLPANARPYLKLQLDSDHNGVDKDLNKIARHMPHDWDGILSSHLGLTAMDIHDIKESHPEKPELQRSACQLIATQQNRLKLFVQAGCSIEMEEQPKVTA